MIPMTDLLDKIRERINRRTSETEQDSPNQLPEMDDEPPHPHFDDWLVELADEDFDNYFEDGDEGKPDTLVVTSNGIKER